MSSTEGYVEARTSKASRDEIKAVKKVLRSRRRPLEDHLSSIDVFLRLDGDASQGPPAPGSFGIRELARRYEKVAKEFRRTRAKLADVEFDEGDKRDFLKVLAELAEAYDARAKMVRSSTPTKIKASLRSVQAHERAASRGLKGLKAYLPKEEQN